MTPSRPGHGKFSTSPPKSKRSLGRTPLIYSEDTDYRRICRMGRYLRQSRQPNTASRRACRARDSCPLPRSALPSTPPAAPEDTLSTWSHSATTVTGIDSTPEMLELAAAKVTKGRLRDRRLDRPPFRRRHFDLAVCTLALTHSPDLRPPIMRARPRPPTGTAVWSSPTSTPSMSY